MKRQRRLMLGVLVLIMALLLGTGSVAAKATKTCFTATETMDDLGGPERGWVSGERVHSRGWAMTNTMVCDDDRFDGEVHHTINLNLDEDNAGRFWGTTKIVPDAHNGAGWWDATFEGSQNADGVVNVSHVGHGRGVFEGLKVKYTGAWNTWPYAGGMATWLVCVHDPHPE